MAYAPLPALVHHRQELISCLSFDTVSDVLWSGSASGSVTAHYPTNVRGVTYPATTKGHPVTRLVASEKDVKAITESGMGSWAKGGMNKWYYNSTHALSTFSEHPSMANAVVLATNGQEASEFIMLNTATGAEIRKVAAPPMVNHLRASHSLLVSAAADGYIRTHDFRTSNKRDSGAAQSSAFAHSGGIQGLEISGNQIFTCGWGFRQSRPHPDPLVKVYDIRSLKPLPPIPFAQGPAHVTVHPKKASSIVITSAEGLVNIVDLSDPVNGQEYQQLPVTSYISSVAFSPTGAYLAFGDAEGYIHMLTSAPTAEDERIPWNGSEGTHAPWPDAPQPLPDIEWTDSTPLNSIGMPYYTEPLLSGSAILNAPASHYPPPAKIPEQVLQSMRTLDFVGYAALPRELRGRRNVAPKAPAPKDEGRFRSKAKRSQDLDDNAVSSVTSAFPRPEIPRKWRQTDIKYSKFGIEDFDFAFYNQTSYSGLETHIPNCYTNAIVQALFFTKAMRAHAKSHITTSCRIEHCLLCELGFLSRMLEDASGTNCQASNFCKVIARKSQATVLGLIDHGIDGSSPDYGTMIQQFNRFVLEEMAIEGNNHPNPVIISQLPTDGRSTTPSPVTQMYGIHSETINECGFCHTVTRRSGMTHAIDLVYPPRKPLPNEVPQLQPSNFSELLSASLERRTSYKATCLSCKQVTTFSSHRIIQRDHLPPLLGINASAFSDDSVQVWMDMRVHGVPKRFLEATASVQGYADDTARGSELPDVVYELRGMVFEVRAGPKTSHLVAVVKVEEPDSSRSPWYLFNDFVVQNISEEEALSFPSTWKVPCLLYLERQDVMGKLDLTGLPSKLDPAILGHQYSVAQRTDWLALKQTYLRPNELPTPGTVVSIDAEFVALQKEETEHKSDGTKKVLRPSLLTLARVSVLRSKGPLSGKPFIDDYIHTTDAIVDYLTEFSGISPGDLDPLNSRHALVPLKVVYKKLRLLVDLGCIFVGHGLSKDFRIINLFVPPHQILDTVDLYFIKERSRRLSLRFLTWYILKEGIQAVTHDSIEDARAALLLYEKYQEYEAEGRFDDVLEEIYREGKKVNFKPPVDESAKATPHNTPGLSPALSNMQIAMQMNMLRNMSPVGFMSTFGFNQIQMQQQQQPSHPAFYAPQAMIGGVPGSGFYDPSFGQFAQQRQQQQQQQWNPYMGDGSNPNTGSPSRGPRR
ncbi:poly(A)-specific ribonuclease [Tulasnella sp. JGI-2019a]|nr:poly(A)-specific ribonuclease [Tulasnella sp. JGI-2019a]